MVGRRQSRARGQRWVRWGGRVAAVAVLTGAAIVAVVTRSHGAPAIDGIACRANGPVVVHLHAHLALYDRGRPVPVPAGIGSAASDVAAPCLYGLHTHRPDGLISVESPTRATYTLGQFFAIWGQPLGRTRVASAGADATHPLRAFVNGRPYHGDPRAIRLAERERITLEVGPPWVLPPSYIFPVGL